MFVTTFVTLSRVLTFWNVNIPQLFVCKRLKANHGSNLDLFVAIQLYSLYLQHKIPQMTPKIPKKKTNNALQGQLGVQ